MLLIVDSTVREDSRTRRLAERLVSRLADDDVRVLHLEDEHLRPFDARTLDRRTRAIEAGRWNSPLLAKASARGKTVKSVDNTVQRIRRKAAKILGEGGNAV